MATWTEGDVPTENSHVHYYRSGTAGKPSVVLLHGFSDMGLCWMHLADDLAPDYDLIALDAAGHGKSGGVEHGFRSRAVSDVLAAIEALGLERPALVGHSMGAGTAARVAADAPERIRGVALEDPPWRDTPPAPVADNATAAPAVGSRAPLGSPAWVAWNRAFKALSHAEQQAATATERPEWAEIDRTYWADAKAQFNLDVLQERVDVSSPPWRETVGRITCPVLLLTAEPERGAIVTPAVADEAAHLWQSGRVAHIPGAGHNIRREQYEPFRAAVVAFLRETSGAG